jgi:heme exporter protein C
MALWTWFHRLASPPSCFRVAKTLQPWFWVPALVLLGYGLFTGLFIAPKDYQQGDAYRIIYIHAPSAWLSLLAYSTMAIASAIAIIWRIKLGHALAAALAPIGASFTVLCLVTGSLWGRPMWGAYWAWDARLTSELILLFLYAGYMALRAAFDELERADRTSAILAMVGLINVPVIHYSVVWWNSLHQGSTVIRAAGPAMPSSMLVPLLACFVGFTLLLAYFACIRLRAEILLRERAASWLNELLETT